MTTRILGRLTTTRHQTAGTPARTGVAADARWVRPSLVTLLAATALLYLWGLGDSGWANQFYAAAVQAGTVDAKAFLFGSLDAGNAITVDKPAASLWLMELSTRAFGMNSWAMLAPQALAGVAAVGLLFAAVRRVAGAAAGLAAGAGLAFTPVAALMFRFNNPDALLTLLLVAGAYCMVRAVERGGLRWVALAGAAVGFAFLTKMLQAFLVLPAFAAMWMVAAPVGVRRRVAGLVAGLAAMVVCAGWWLALVELWPAGSRPYVGGSTDNSILQLTLGYNGLQRLSGGSGPGGGAGPGGGGNTGFGGATGVWRMFNDAFGTQVAWLIPVAALMLGAGLWLTRRAPRTDPTRASLILWGGWSLVTAGVFSMMSGVIHPYYAVALAPGLAATAAVGGAEVWRHRHHRWARLLGAAAVLCGALPAYLLLGRAPDWHPELRAVVLVAGLVGAGMLLVPGAVRTRAHGYALGVVCAVAMLGAPVAYSLQTAATPHTGSIPTAGPVTAVTGAFGGGGGAPPPTAGGGFTPPGGGTAGGAPGLGGATRVDTELVRLLSADTGHRWAAATTSAMASAPLQLASGRPVMAIGGFNGSDNAPTLAQFQRWVAEGRIGYFIAGGNGGGPGGGGPGGGSSSATAITRWVAANFTATTVGGQTVYVLSTPATAVTT